ncbi:similar to Saccharomyces cerevisiae YDL150W RPC53 RNA polymerase III subunit C53 [Maudiozyma saulgeensis]|uniref:Similar to Saccharomyces cerevisiae YDL150W RPC53 RNA polymerase III subunit C53 n=1 Tax=Maudiozyma saulgeensis TaxID=1789683 RepID=A0A1X7QXV7_9SACH|nr:similar to Saccharomyces cerevisiae YDL150W RPC53 RNA polymerase III subunit C53 [Kazachstania saulgeensis]
MSSGRLPSLRDSAAGKASLKFKPKAVARRSKEERDASALKIKKDEDLKSKVDQKKSKKPMPMNQKKRVPRYLNNTHVISTGPLAAGNFVDSSRSDMRRGIVKVEGGDKSLVRKGLQSIENHTGDSDDDYDSDMKEKLNIIENDESGSNINQAKFNMGREYTTANFKQDDSDAEEEDLDMEEEAVQRRRIEELFPVRPLRIRHEDVEVVEQKIDESITETTTREPTPATGLLKSEETTSLHDVLKNKEAELQNELQNLHIDPDSHAIDAEEVKHEQAMLIKDHISILKKLDKLNKKSDRFLLFQMPYKLPIFDEVTTKKEDTEVTMEIEPTTNEGTTIEKIKEESSEADKKPKKKTKKTTKKKEHVPQEELTGNVGSIRIHKSGKISIRIGNAIMETSKASEATFLQDVIALNEDPDAPGVELLGRVEGKVMVTPSFDA